MPAGWFRQSRKRSARSITRYATGVCRKGERVMSENESEEKLKVQDCVAMKWGWFNTLESLWFRALLTAIPAVIIVSAIFTWAQIADNATRPIPTDILVGLALPIWVFIFLMSVAIWHESFVEYWQRNVVGYQIWYWRDQDGQIFSAIHQTRRIFSVKGWTTLVFAATGTWPTSGSSLACVFPLGGWLPNLITSHKKISDNWRLKVYDVQGDSLMVELRDNHGCCLIKEAGEAVKLAFTYMSVDEALRFYKQRQAELTKELSEAQQNLVAVQEEKTAVLRCFNTVVCAAAKAVAEIMNTSRLGQSDEAMNIRIKLAQAVIAVLPEGNPWLEPLQQSLKLGPAKRPPRSKRRQAATANSE